MRDAMGLFGSNYCGHVDQLVHSGDGGPCDALQDSSDAFAIVHTGQRPILSESRLSVGHCFRNGVPCCHLPGIRLSSPFARHMPRRASTAWCCPTAAAEISSPGWRGALPATSPGQLTCKCRIVLSTMSEMRYSKIGCEGQTSS